MQITIDVLRQNVQEGRVTKAALMRESGLDWKTVNNALLAQRRTHTATMRVLLDAAKSLLAGDIPIQSQLETTNPRAEILEEQA